MSLIEIQAPGLAQYKDVTPITESVGTFVSLYAGAGGLDLGFALAGFTPVWVNELDPTAVESHELAFKRLRDERPHLADSEWTTVQGSLLDVPTRRLPTKGSADLVIGGPPCQGFSVAGKMNPDDVRSEHVYHFLDVVKRVQPQAFLLENVKALYENQRWASVRDELSRRATKLGYTTVLTLCNASHFGAPQARERMLFIGVRDGEPVLPTPTTADRPPTVRDALAQLPHYGEPGNDSKCTAKITAAKEPVMRRSPYAGMLFNGAGRPMNLDAPSFTLPASMGGNKTPIVDQHQIDNGGESWIVEYHQHLAAGGKPANSVPARMRRLTVQEASAIQTFPIGMEWAGPQSAQFRQIGNAVPPRLALAAAQAIKASLGIN